MYNLNAVILPVITFQSYPTLATSVETRSSALVLRQIKFQRYPTPTPSVHSSCSALVSATDNISEISTQGYEILCFHFWLDAIKLKTRTSSRNNIY